VTLVSIAAIAAAVLVPVALTIGFSKQLTPEHRLLPLPASACKLIIGFQASTPLHAAASDALPADVAGQVTSWVTLRSSRVHVATFRNGAALKRALAALQTNNNINFAIMDFQVVPDRQVTAIIDPDQLFDIAQGKNRHLLQHPPSQGNCSTSSGSPAASSHSQTPQAAISGTSRSTPSAAFNKVSSQRLAKRKAKRWLTSLNNKAAAKPAEVPATMLQSQKPGRLLQAEEQQGNQEYLQPALFGSSQGRADETAASSDLLHAAAFLQAVAQFEQRKQQVAMGGFDECSSPQQKQKPQKDSSCSCSSCSSTDTVKEHALGNSSSRSNGRQLQQQPKALNATANQQQQQQPPKQQKRAAGVAWYLASDAIQAAQAWNSSIGRFGNRNGHAPCSLLCKALSPDGVAADFVWSWPLTNLQLLQVCCQLLV
jgi:hypothetical protein